MARQTALAKKIRDSIASVIGKDDEELLNNISGRILTAFPDLPGLAGEAEAKGGAAIKQMGGALNKTKGYQAGGKSKKTKGMASGGVSRGMGAATKGGRYSRSS